LPIENKQGVAVSIKFGIIRERQEIVQRHSVHNYFGSLSKEDLMIKSLLNNAVKLLSLKGAVLF
jgi:hypothetical protein